MVAVAGCGDAEYASDFTENTVPFFTQKQKLDTALSGPWEKFGYSVRIPKSFTEVAPPPAPTQEQKDDPDWEPPDDLRQPDYLLDYGLPGMKGAWEGPLPGEGQRVGERWLYVLDNRKLEDDEIDPGLPPEDFVYEIADRFARSMERDGQFLATPEPEQFKTMTFPQSPQPFAPPVQFETPQAPLVGDFGDGLVHRVELYVHRAGSLTTVVALVMPEDAMAGPEIGEPRDLMLQTFAAGQTPRSAAAPAGG
ncbi:MAG: hypothetical protein AAF907_16125, partial [Planctomycetota bacterium]